MIASFANVTDLDRASEQAYVIVQNDFGIQPYNCQQLDVWLKKIDDEIIKRSKKLNLSLVERQVIDQLRSKKAFWESSWSRNGCRDVIEKIRTQTAGVKETEFAIKAEQSVLGTNRKEQNVYIGLGIVVVLVGLYIIIRK